LTANTLPYGWSANVRSDRAPTLAGEGASIHAANWDALDGKYGRFFDGSAYRPDNADSPYHGPGENTPVANFYTPFFESWPIHLLDPNHGFDADGWGGEYWNNLVDNAPETFWNEAPDVIGSLPDSYKEGVRNVVRDWFEHAQAMGWLDTNFQIYLNHKYYYDNCAALWILEECSTAEDFRAVGAFHEIYRQGAALANAPDVNWHWRIDISDRWGQNYGRLDNLINFVVMNDSSTRWHWPNIRYRNTLNSVRERWTWYGTGPAPQDSGLGHIRKFLQAWAQGLDGGVPYWNNYDTSWTDAEPLSIVYSGNDVPGFGRYEGAIASTRMKLMRQAQQIVELLNLLSNRPGWTRERLTQAVLDKYSDGDWDRSFDGLSEADIYRLHSDLIVELAQEDRPSRSMIRLR